MVIPNYGIFEITQRNSQLKFNFSLITDKEKCEIGNFQENCDRDHDVEEL